MTKIITTSTFASPFGELVIGSFGDRICLCDWRFRKMRSSIDIRIAQRLKAEYTEGTSALIEQAKSELSEYFEGERTVFSVPILPVGSDFQKEVWQELTLIPFGKTTSYLDLSLKLGNVKAIRAVASANSANALSILVPCHRVIGSDGGLVGYAEVWLQSATSSSLKVQKRSSVCHFSFFRQFAVFLVSLKSTI